MKALIAATLASLLLPCGVAGAETAKSAQGAFTLTLSVEGVRSSDGTLMAELLKANPETGKAAAVGGTGAPAVTGTTTLSFAGLEPGDYAVRLFHDEDGDGEMKTNAFGIPKEGFGFSNGAKAKFGPPAFADMKVTVSADTASTAIMAY
jgi:uncharacterized protein (DUF2141 family)